MPKTFRPYAADQMMLLPSSVQEWVPEGDMAHFISDIVDALDLSEIEAVYEEELRGYPPYHPRMMTKLWVYAYAGHPQLPEAGEAGHSGRWLHDAGGGQPP
jgi:transposase